MHEIVQKHLDIVSNANNLLNSKTNGVDEDKGKDTYPEVKIKQVDNDGDKTQSQQQMVVYDIVAHNINEINEQLHVEVNDKISKEDADDDQKQHNVNHALKVAYLYPDVQSKGMKNRANAKTSKPTRTNPKRSARSVYK
ncbi:hypothetical protein H5410_005195 [Solanum commersonii]|uniref:Uncharacterized protein n=1 Tax=Solanum commersonii TaxID=4109 RepID=A0A9J6A602_SOLCO|nr:hypothetical protein H5410_005195 [Solanum commersonii]